MRNRNDFIDHINRLLPDKIEPVGDNAIRVTWGQNRSAVMVSYEISFAEANRILAAKASEGSGAIDEGL